MKAKRFILMLLVALMSVTGAWAGVVETDYTIVSNQFTLITPEAPPSYYSCNSSQANMVIKTNHAIFLAQLYVRNRVVGNPSNPNNIKIEGSNDQSAWTTINESSLNPNATDGYVSVSALDKYQYFRLTFSGLSNSLEFWILTISEDKIDGAGTSQDPYTLNNVGHLKQYADLITEGNNAAHAKLTKDLDMSQTTFASIDNANYVGTLDGNGYSIKNLKSANGLFKSIGAATIKNLTIENATLSATDEYSGVLAAQANGTTFQNCIVKGTISASSANVGGLVGNAYGATFTQCYSVGDFSVGNANCGGLVGMASGNTKLTQCYSVTDKDNDGGQHLPLCGASDGSCTASLCYHYGSASSSLSTAVEQADVTSGRLAYLLNNGDYKGPYFQRIGTDAYPSLTNTGDNGYVYLALDDATYTNACPHRDCTIYPFKAPTCVGASGNVEYNQCNNSLCKKYLLASNRDVVSNVKEFTLSYKAVNIQEHTLFTWSGFWNFSEYQTKDNTTYHNVMKVSHVCNKANNGDYVISYTSGDDDPTMNFHLFFSSNIGAGGFSVRFYVNGIERSASRINYPNSTSERHDEVSIDGLHKFDIIKVVYTYSQSGGNDNTQANFFIGTQKPVPTSHNLQKHELSYNCIDGGCKEHYECSRCANVFTQNTTPESDADITTLSAVTLAPMGEHNFVEKHLEGNLYGMQCQNTYCTTFDLDNYVLKKYNNDTNLTLSYDGSTYTAKEPVSLIDGNAFITPIAFDAPSLTYNRYYPENVWSAWFTPFDVNASYLLDNGLTPAYIEGIHNYDDDEDGTIDRTVMEIVKISKGRVLAGTPLLVRAVEGYSSQLVLSDVTMKANDVLNNIHTETASTKFDFIGTYTGTTAAAGDNIYSLNNTGAMVHRTGKILPLRWYCQIEQKPSFIGEETSPALARAIYIKVIGEEDQETGIRTLYNEAGQTLERADGIFDLSGRKLSAPQRGMINIINGKKQFVR